MTSASFSAQLAALLVLVIDVIRSIATECGAVMDSLKQYSGAHQMRSSRCQSLKVLAPGTEQGDLDRYLGRARRMACSSWHASEFLTRQVERWR